jgi:retron-type reverse transcriptase
MKILERVVDSKVWKSVKIDEMQCGFMPERRTTDAIFIVRQLQEKYLAKKKNDLSYLWMAFADLEKAFDIISHEVVCSALRILDWLNELCP